VLDVRKVLDRLENEFRVHHSPSAQPDLTQPDPESVRKYTPRARITPGYEAAKDRAIISFLPRNWAGVCAFSVGSRGHSTCCRPPTPCLSIRPQLLCGPKTEALDCTVLHCPTWISATGPVLTFRRSSGPAPSRRWRNCVRSGPNPAAGRRSAGPGFTAVAPRPRRHSLGTRHGWLL